jgi:hypothetical protein
LELETLPALTSLQGLNKLARADQLMLNNLTKLTRWRAWTNLNSHLTAIYIKGNPALKSLRRVAAVSGVDRATVSDNQALAQCEVDWLGK